MENLNDIRVFLKVIEKRSFKAAAAELRVSASVVSKHVSNLEENLGVQLLKRSTRRLVMTSTGAIFYERCRKVFEELESVRDAISQHNVELKGPIKIQTTIGAGRYLLRPAIQAFTERYPEITFDLAIGPMPANLLEHDLDVVIIQWIRGHDSTLEYRTLAPIKYYVCAAPSYIAVAGRPRHPAQLKKFNCLIHEPQKGASEWRFTGPSGELRVKVRGNFRTNNSIILKDAVLDGLGIARMPDHAALKDIEAGKLVVLFDNALSDGRAITAVYPRNRHQPARLRVFLDFLEEFISNTIQESPLS